MTETEKLFGFTIPSTELARKELETDRDNLIEEVKKLRVELYQVEARVDTLKRQLSEEKCQHNTCLERLSDYGQRLSQHENLGYQGGS